MPNQGLDSQPKTVLPAKDFTPNQGLYSDPVAIHTIQRPQTTKDFIPAVTIPATVPILPVLDLSHPITAPAPQPYTLLAPKANFISIADWLAGRLMDAIA